jgi:hypothetical protein
MPADSDAFAVLGLTPVQRRAYELLLTQPSAAVVALSPQWTEVEPLPTVLGELEDRGLASSEPGPPQRFRAVTPAVAFDARLADFEERLEHARRHVGTLDAAYQARPATRDASAMIEVVTGQRAVRQRLLQIQRGARAQIGMLAKPPGFLEGEINRSPLQRGLACRTIYDRSAIEHPGALSTVEQMISSGQLARVLPDLPVSLYLADEKIAVLPLRRAPATDAVIVVHPSALLDALIKLFEGLWARALPLHPPGDNARSGALVQRLITLLLSGLTDEAIAHQLGLSHRTVQRRVAAMMADLGAHTRFQAGVQAALNRNT